MNSLDKLFSVAEDVEVIGLTINRNFPRYFCTPVQATIIANLGVDGIHYCIAKGNGDLENSPVYVISPMMPDHYVELVGRNLIDFLSLVVKCKDASALECISYMEEDRFNKHIDDINIEILKTPEYSQKVEKAILCLKSLFNLEEIDNIYRHVQETKSDPKYHARLLFSQEYYDLLV